jgi:hypothetical protein
MKTFRLALALAVLLGASACSGDLTGPGTASDLESPPPPPPPVIGSPG